MTQSLRDRINRKLETLSDERLYQVLDFVEFLESKYAARQAPATNVFQRFADSVEDRLRAGRVSATTIAETMSLMNKAMGVLDGVAAAGKSVANDLVNATTPAARPPAPGAGTPAAPPPSAAASAPPTQPQPRSSGEPTT